MDDLLTQEEDVAACCVERLGPIAATILRAVSRAVHTALTHTDWAQQFWKRQTICNPALEQVPKGDCWFATFASYHGDAHMRPIRTQRLAAALQGRGLELRDDSWLCSGYIAGRPQVGSLADVVNGMEVMTFLFRTTSYAKWRRDLAQARWEEACVMAMDAQCAGEALPVTPLEYPPKPPPVYYHLAYLPQELSELAKRSAIEEWVNFNPAAAAAYLVATDAVPLLLKEQVAALVRGEPWASAEDREVPYTKLNGEQQSVRRSDVRGRVAARMNEEAVALAPHLDALRRVAAAAVGTTHHFPASLTKQQRARLRNEAVELELAHESRDVGTERRFVAWRMAQG